MAIPSGKVEEVADLKSLQLTGVYNFWLGLTPDDSPLVTKDAGTEEIISMNWTAPWRRPRLLNKEPTPLWNQIFQGPRLSGFVHRSRRPRLI